MLGIYGVVYWITESNFPGPLFGGVGVIFVLGVQGFILALVGSIWRGSSETWRAGRCKKNGEV